MASAVSVLIADHEPEVGEMSRRYLARAGLPARVVTSPAATLSALAAREAGLFVIDLTMPGLEVAALRRLLLPAPGTAPLVVFLLDRHGVRPRSLSDGLGCHPQFLARPFSPRALVEAVTGLLHPPPPGPAHAAGQGLVPAPRSAAGDAQVLLDEDHRRVTLAGRETDLTRTEFALLAALARQPGQPLSRQRLLAALEAERGKRPTARAIDVYITQLRAKLGPTAIRTVHGVGYALWTDS